jgi:PBP1b-binding outer membrane lipoprotein LpoB
VRRIALLASALTLALTLAGCGSDEPTPEPTDPTSSSTPETPDETTDETTEPSEPEVREIEIEFEGDQAPEVERIQIAVGETVELVVTSDQPGELHVHSDPEQTLAYDVGTTRLSLTIDRPGVVEVERHEPEALVLQLEVR